MSLNYSTLTHDNWGFGEGFSLGLTQYDSTSNLLSLSSGEKYRLARGSDVIRHQKLKHLRFTFTNGRDDSQGYQLTWKDGKVEYLTLVGYGFFTVSRIVSPLGHTVNLNWDFSGQIPILRTISDAYGELCSIDYRDNGATVTVLPQTTARYVTDEMLYTDRSINKVNYDNLIGICYVQKLGNITLEEKQNLANEMSNCHFVEYAYVEMATLPIVSDLTSQKDDASSLETEHTPYFVSTQAYKDGLTEFHKGIDWNTHIQLEYMAKV